MPLTSKEFAQIEKYLKVALSNHISYAAEIAGFLKDYVEEPKIAVALGPLPADQLDSQTLQQRLEMEGLKQQTKQILKQKGQQEDATGGCMAEIASDSPTPTYTQISEQVPHGAYLPLGDIVYKLTIDKGKRTLTADLAQTERYLKQRGG